jgi:hypothetical protein
MSANPKVIAKKNLIIFCSPEHWDLVWQKILADNSPGIAVSWVLKRELGFTVRRHDEWVSFVPPGSIVPRNRCVKQVHLDFFNEAALTWFQLKYL